MELDLKFSLALFLILTTTLVMLTSYFPISEMYSIGTSWEIQQIALFLAEGKDISGYVYWGTGVQYPAPAHAFVLAFFYTFTKDINIASVINNLMFSILAIFAFESYSGSRKLSILLVLVPFWLVATFTSIPEMSAIFLFLLSFSFYKAGKYKLAIGISALSGLFRIEGFGVSAIMLLHSRKWKLLIFPLLFGVLFLSWYQFVFGDALLMFKEHSKVSMQPEFMVNSVTEALNSGLYGVGKVVYTTILLLVSVVTVIVAKMRFGNDIKTLLIGYFFLVHTILFPVGIYFEYPRFFLILAPLSLITFKKEAEKWFIPLCVLLAIVSIILTFGFYSKATWGQII